MQSEPNPSDLTMVVKLEGKKISLVPCFSRSDGGCEPIPEQDAAIFSPELHLVLAAVKALEKIATSLQHLPPSHHVVALRLLQMSLDLLMFKSKPPYLEPGNRASMFLNRSVYLRSCKRDNPQIHS